MNSDSVISISSLSAARPLRDNAWAYLRELGWREFSHHLLFHFPDTPEQALYDKYRDFPWRTSKKHLEAWQKGRTGYPLVDAGMRQLWQTGWMHNRVRMIVGSFLVKVAGCGADAAPFFRIFNPVKQSEKFDPSGSFIRSYVPELAGLPDKWIHNPGQAPPDVLKAADVTLGDTYPEPIVDHKEARERALEALDKVKGGRQ